MKWSEAMKREFRRIPTSGGVYSVPKKKRRTFLALEKRGAIQIGLGFGSTIGSEVYRLTEFGRGVRFGMELGKL